MHYVPPSRWSIALFLYFASGLTLGISQLPRLFGNFGLKPGIGTALIINILVPLVVVAVTVWYPRKRTAAPGAILAYAGVLLGMRLLAEWRFWIWPASFVTTSISPIAVVGSLVCALIACAVVAMIAPWRRVGLPETDDGPRCACGYPLRGLSGSCPECGAPIAPLSTSKS